MTKLIRKRSKYIFSFLPTYKSPPLQFKKIKIVPLWPSLTCRKSLPHFFEKHIRSKDIKCFVQTLLKKTVFSVKMCLTLLHRMNIYLKKKLWQTFVRLCLLVKDSVYPWCMISVFVKYLRIHFDLHIKSIYFLKAYIILYMLI
jgi:hypothetical protein